MPRTTTSEVGSAAQSMLQAFLELQSASFIEVLNSVRASNATENKIVFPKYNSNSPSADAVSWCNTVEFLFADSPLEGSALIIALIGSLEGEAAQLLTQVCYPSIQWIDFKELFIQRFKGTETSDAANLLSSRPKQDECLSAYGNRLVTSLMAKWKSMNMEQIAVSLEVAHAANIDNRFKRLIFTTSMSTCSELQKELNSFSFENNRQNSSDTYAFLTIKAEDCF